MKTSSFEIWNFEPFFIPQECTLWHPDQSERMQDKYMVQSCNAGGLKLAYLCNVLTAKEQIIWFLKAGALRSPQIIKVMWLCASLSKIQNWVSCTVRRNRNSKDIVSLPKDLHVYILSYHCALYNMLKGKHRSVYGAGFWNYAPNS